MLRRQAGTPTMQACFLPGQPLLLAAGGGDGTVHLLDLSRPGKCPQLTADTVLRESIIVLTFQRPDTTVPCKPVLI